MAKIPVLIAGGGPVGLALAVELGLAGIQCTLVERRDGTLSVPKMSGLSVRSMELNRRWGISETVKRAGWPHSTADGSAPAERGGPASAGGILSATASWCASV